MVVETIVEMSTEERELIRTALYAVANQLDTTAEDLEAQRLGLTTNNTRDAEVLRTLAGILKQATVIYPHGKGAKLDW